MKKQNIEMVEKIFNDFNQIVKDSYPSIYTKDDVQSLLYKIYFELYSVIKSDSDGDSSGNLITQEVHREILITTIKEIKDTLIDEIENIGFDSSDIVQYSSATFNIRHGNEIEIDSIDIDEYEITSHINRSITYAIDNYIKDCEIKNNVNKTQEHEQE